MLLAALTYAVLLLVVPKADEGRVKPPLSTEEGGASLHQTYSIPIAIFGIALLAIRERKEVAPFKHVVLLV